MTNSPPPGQRPPRLRDDEPIALLVAFLAFGAILWWALSQGRGGWDAASLIPGLSAPSPTPSITASPVPEMPADRPSPGIRGEATGGEATGEVELVPSPQPTIEPGVSPYAPSPQPTTSPIDQTRDQTRVTPAPTVSQTPRVGAKPVSPAAGAIAFSDVPQNYWAYPFISALAARGIVGGFPDGTFKPNQPVTRAQFAVQLQKAFAKSDQLPPKQFTDIPSGDKWATAVDKAVKANFMSGYPEGDFRPEQQVSRTEAVASMVRGLGLTQPADAEAILQPYQDRQQVPAWARGRIAAAIGAGLFSGDQDTKLLNPNQPATRADIAALVYKSLAKTDTSPKP